MVRIAGVDFGKVVAHMVDSLEQGSLMRSSYDLLAYLY